MTDTPQLSPWQHGKRMLGLVVLVGAVLAGLHLIKLDLAATELTVHYRLDDHHQVRRLEASLRASGSTQVVAVFAAERPDSQPVQKTRVSDGTYDLRIDLEFAPDGKVVTVHRELSVLADSQVTIDLRGLFP